MGLEHGYTPVVLGTAAGIESISSTKAVLTSPKAYFFLGLIKNPLKKKYWGNSPIFTT